jgi:hypothetical protein
MKPQTLKALKKLFTVDNLTEAVMDDGSAFRTLIHRKMPHFDRLAQGENASNTSRMLATLLLSSVKGTGSAASEAARKSLSSLSGLRGGSGVGAVLGGGVGAAKSYNQEGGDWKDLLRNIGTGASIGAGGGAATGLLGRAAGKGLAAGAKHFDTRVKGWDDLIDMGVLPRVMSEGGPGKGSLWQKVKKIVDSGDQADVGILGAGDNAAGGLFTGPFTDAINNAKIKDLNAGLIINPDVARLASSPAIWGKLQKSTPGLEKFHGKLQNTRQIDLGNAAASGPVGDRARLIAAIAEEANATLPTPSKWTPRRTTESLLDDLRNSKKNRPKFTHAKFDIDDDDALDYAYDYVDSYVGRNGKLKDVGLTRDEMMEVVARKSNAGNVNVSRIWDPAYDGAGSSPFSVDLKSDVLAQAANNPKIVTRSA